MKKKTFYKVCAYLIMITLAAQTIESKCHRRHRYYGGYGYGWGYPAYGWGYPGYYGWGPGITFAVGGGSRPTRRRARDDMGRNYWSVINNTSSPILVRPSGGSYKKIQPGEKRSIRRKGSFKVKVKSPDEQRLKFKTEQHFIEINHNPAGKLTYNSWNE